MQAHRDSRCHLCGQTILGYYGRLSQDTIDTLEMTYYGKRTPPAPMHPLDTLDNVEVFEGETVHDYCADEEKERRRVEARKSKARIIRDGTVRVRM